MNKLEKFSSDQIRIVSNTAAVAEDLVNNFYKMSQSQWFGSKYDIKTLADLKDDEIIHGPFAQVVRYEGKKKDRILGSSVYDFYKICIQDHSVLSVMNKCPEIKLSPFILYIVAHELIHVLRFCKFFQNFDASSHEKMEEEGRVHAQTRKIIEPVNLQGLQSVLKFYKRWDKSF